MRNLRQYGLAAVLALAAIMGYEGFVSPPYQDQAGVWTNGYGNTEGVSKSTPPVTEPKARATLQRQIDGRAAKLDAMLERPAGPNQTAAYLSLMFNIGVDRFRRSTVLRLHNAGRFAEACDAILMWNKHTDPKTGKLVVNRGLANRRAKEAAQCRLDL